MPTSNLHTFNQYNHRLHRTPYGCLPGVTTILSNTKDTSFLDRWEQRIGKEEAELIRNKAIDRGNNLHAFVEAFFANNHDTYPGDFIYDDNIDIVTKMVNTLYSYLERIVPLYIEQPTYSILGFAGSPDCIGNIDGKLTVFDWKNSLKLKKEEYIVDYYLQTAAYALSASETFGIEIEQTKIVIVNTQGTLQEFTLNTQEIKDAQVAFLSRLDSYNDKFGGRF